MESPVDWKSLFIALVDGCYRNEGTVPNLANIHDSGWVNYSPLTKQELEEAEKIIREREEIFNHYFDTYYELEE